MPEVEIKIPTNTELLETLTPNLTKEDSIPPVEEEVIEADVETTPAPQPEQVDEPEKLEVDEVEDEKQIPKEIFSQKLLDELGCGVNPHALECLGRSTKNIGKPAHETSDKDPSTTPTTD